MDASPAPSAEHAIENGDSSVKNGVDMARIEAMVTDEQVLSDSVARKRRKFTKKRSTSLTRREPTPARNVEEKTTTSEEEVPVDARPKTPERPRRPKRFKSKSETNGRALSCSDMNRRSWTESTCTSPTESLINGSTSISRNDSFNARSKTSSLDRKKSLTDMAHDEMIAFLNKTKKSITSAAKVGRDRFRKAEKAKRSQSAPHQFTEEELLESMKKANLINGKGRPRKYSMDQIPSITQEIYLEINPIMPQQTSTLRQRKGPRQYSDKVIEVLDPKTSNVVCRKTIMKPDFRLYDLFRIFQFYSPMELYRSYRTYKAHMKQECKAIKVLWNRCMLEIFLIMVFCGLGGMIFKFTEGSFENYYKCGVKRVKRDFIDMLWIRSHNLREEDWKSLARNKLRNFEEELHAAHEAGMTSYSGQRSWSFLNGVVYALTVITTIGYGHIYPTTTTGRALTIVYALIGIPLFLIALTDFGKLFTRCIKFLWSFVRRVYYTGSCRQVRKTAHVHEIFKGAQMMYEIATFRRPSQNTDPEDPHRNEHNNTNHKSDLPTSNELKPMDGLTPVSTATYVASGDTDTPTTPAISNFEIDDEFNLPISVALFILVAYIFIGALGFCAVEKWNFFASFYFVFISMSTIGFGDYVPANPISMILSIVYLVFGLALMSMCINVVQVKLSDTFQQASQKLGATIGFEVDENSITTVENLEIPPVHGIMTKPTVDTIDEAKEEPSERIEQRPNHLASPEQSDLNSPSSDLNANNVPPNSPSGS
ncbi:unnamed protein product [Acanthoscelides obtectus]|uniref:Potassium channel domain-containing protein n=1 Tax=Acanthoscelides obtectus TaxID=200917 RepID=A0A9P0LQ99_ACAOB|nr:unnamed protein product [Acanthoscelides obtectus]CAK1620090.1 TWiK family of potassium channels protein 18 [Acanthoscelides obtectus]